jgi:hypothetical protein
MGNTAVPSANVPSAVDPDGLTRHEAAVEQEQYG